METIRDHRRMPVIPDAGNEPTAASGAGRSTGRQLAWIFLLALAVRFLFLFLADNNGTDAPARYEIALAWARDPTRLPSRVWLPLHFWLLGTILWAWPSEWAARLLTVLLGGLTVLPYWGIARRISESRRECYSTLLFALFGFHIAYSVTTSSEAPTIFLLASGLYYWLRAQSGEGWWYLVPSGAAICAASLCRFEAWLVAPILAILLLPFTDRRISTWFSRQLWGRVIGFGFLAGAGAIGWMLFSWFKWGDPLASPHRTVWLNLHTPLAYHPPFLYRLIVVPGALLAALSPLIVGLAIPGIWRALRRLDLVAGAPGVLAICLATFHFVNSLKSEMTQARYTLMYSWLLIPYAFEGLLAIPRRGLSVAARTASAALVALFLVWQGGIIAGAYYGPPAVADRLAVMSPTLPLSLEIRTLAKWLRTHWTPGESVVVDAYNYEAGYIIRTSGIPSDQAFPIPYPADRQKVEEALKPFLERKHPRFLVYAPGGQFGSLWPLGNSPEGFIDALGLRLHRRWEGKNYRIYGIELLR